VQRIEPDATACSLRAPPLSMAGAAILWEKVGARLRPSFPLAQTAPPDRITLRKNA